jgi:NADH-quinone oxidoreductase subunit H
MISIILKILVVIIAVLITLAYFTGAERKLMGAIQRRRGPNVVGFIGLLQPLADGLKLFAKETILPSTSNIFIFLLAPVASFILSLMNWAVIAFTEYTVVADIKLGLLYLLALSSLNVYGILLSGWSSNSKYAFLGALRSTAQMISYEISIGFIVITVCICAGSFNISNIVWAQREIWFVAPLLPMCGMFFVSMLAETNRHPFDLPEAESELVSGYNVEYSGMTFALFFLSEYANMVLMSALSSILFLGGWWSIIPLLEGITPSSIWFTIKVLFGITFFIVSRATLPRYRYDKLMDLGWKNFLPLSIGYLTLTTSIMVTINGLPG